MDPETARTFLTKHHHAVLATRRRSQGLQMSPVTAGVDGDGAVEMIGTCFSKFWAATLRRRAFETLRSTAEGTDWPHPQFGLDSIR